MHCNPRTWHVVLVQDCNLRCRYCVTGHGRYGAAPLTMPAERRRQLCRFIFEHLPEDGRTAVELGGGETLLDPECAFEVLTALRWQADQTGADLQLSITTNGTCLNRDVLQRLIDLKVTLGFSIDGPREQHDACRLDREGKGTHDRALANFRLYARLLAEAGSPQEASVNSVFSDASDLLCTDAFWRAEGVPRYQAAIQAKTRFEEGGHGAWERRRSRYLRQFRKLAQDAAGRAAATGVAGGTGGPTALAAMWDVLEGEKGCQPCGAGYSVAAVDAHGFLYPCDGFVGYAQHRVGDLEQGFDPEALAAFREKRRRAAKACAACWARFLCGDGCCAGNPSRGVVRNTPGGCAFARRLAAVTIEAYHLYVARRNGP